MKRRTPPYVNAKCLGAIASTTPLADTGTDRRVDNTGGAASYQIINNLAAAA